MAEGVPAGLEVGELVEGGAGRRQEDDRVLTRGRGVGIGPLDRPLQGPTFGDRRLAGQHVGEGVGGFADQIGLFDAGKEVGQTLDAAEAKQRAEVTEIAAIRDGNVDRSWVDKLLETRGVAYID